MLTNHFMLEPRVATSEEETFGKLMLKYERRHGHLPKMPPRFGNDHISVADNRIIKITTRMSDEWQTTRAIAELAQCDGNAARNALVIAHERGLVEARKLSRSIQWRLITQETPT